MPTTRVLYRAAPAWEVGAGTDDVVRGSHYPDDYVGKAISIVGEGHEFSAGDLADENRRVVDIDLTEEEAANLRCGRAKIESGRAAPVTFDDRWGEVGSRLSKRFGALAETLEQQAAVLDAGDAADHPFNVELRRVTRSLPAMVTHSGAGLYEVGPGKTYSTIQSALDQLWTDQGATEFTASQTIRIFAGTYNESVTINAAMKTNEKHYLLIEANGTDSVTVDGGATNAFTAVPRGRVRFERLIMAYTGYGIYDDTAWYTASHVEVRGCTFGSGYRAISLTTSTVGGLLVEDCVVTDSGVSPASHSSLIRRCQFYGGTGVWGGQQGVQIESCVFDGCDHAIKHGGSHYYGVTLSVVNSTFYGSTVADISAEWTEGGTRRGLADIVALNNIHKNSALAYWLPEEAQLGNVNRNCFHGCTKIARAGITDYTTLADWRAYSDEWGQGPDVDSLDSDPLLADPGNDDFGQQAGSPCWRAGYGSGVVSDYLGTAFDVHFPDIGAWSSLGSGVAGGSGTYDAIRSALDVALSGYQASNVAWENSEFEPTVGTSWLRPTFMPAEPEQADLGDSGRNRLTGIYQVSVFAPTGEGAGEAESKAEDLVTYFKRGKTFVSGGVTVRVRRAWRSAAAQEADWYHVPVSVMWFAYAAN
jgi:hypothetical protein